MKNIKSSAYLEGYQACYDGKEDWDNPYNKYVAEYQYMDWEEGYWAAADNIGYGTW